MYLLALIKLGNVRASVRLLYTLRDGPIARGAMLLQLYEETLRHCESSSIAQVSAVLCECH